MGNHAEKKNSLESSVRIELTTPLVHETSALYHR